MKTEIEKTENVGLIVLLIYEFLIILFLKYDDEIVKRV